MTTTTTKEIEALEIEANELAAMECLVETNSGTFGATEACRKTGSGDAGEYKIFARVGDGKRRVVGYDPANAPGYARHFGTDLSDKQAKLRTLRSRIAALRKSSR